MLHRKGLSSRGIFFLMLLVWSPSDAKEEAILLPKRPNENAIENLVLDYGNVTLGMDKQEELLKPYYILSGTFRRKNWILLDTQKRAIPVSKQFKFRLKINIKNETSSFRLFAVGPTGEIESQVVRVQIKELEEFYQKHGRPKPEKIPLTKEEKPPPSPFHFSLGSNLTRASYIEKLQERPSSYQAILLTLKASASFKLLENFDLGIGGFYSALPLRKSTSATGHFLGLNFRGGFWIPLWKGAWNLGVLGGYYFTTMMVNSFDFGYRDVGGPQLFPVLRRKFNNNSYVSFYFKYSPVSNRLQLLKLTSREIAGGMAYGFPNSSISPTLDIAHLSLDLPQLDNFKATNLTISLGLSLNF